MPIFSSDNDMTQAVVSTYAPVLIAQQRLTSLEEVKQLYNEQRLESILRSVGMSSDYVAKVLQHLGSIAAASLPQSSIDDQLQTNQPLFISSDIITLKELNAPQVERFLCNIGRMLRMDIKLYGEIDGICLLDLTKDDLKDLLENGEQLEDRKLEKLLKTIQNYEKYGVKVELLK